jgi:hypothetical protein
MNELDFLPVAYRAKHDQRKMQPRRVLAIAAVGLLIVVGVYGQYANRRRVAAELDVARREHASAMDRARQLGQVQSLLHAARAEAEWLTYLRHPWPRTQLLAAILAPLPDSVNLVELRILREKPSPANGHALPGPKAKPETPAAAKPLAAEQDLARLRDEIDTLQTVVLLSGVTDENAALHRYLGQLGGTPLFSHVELTLIESAPSASASASQFSLRLTVRPGYGQPSGPQPTERSLAKARRVETASRTDRAAPATTRPGPPAAVRLPEGTRS